MSGCAAPTAVPGQKRIVGPAFTLRFVPAREDLATPESWSSPISTRRRSNPCRQAALRLRAMGVTDAGIFGDILCARMKVRALQLWSPMSRA